MPCREYRPRRIPSCDPVNKQKCCRFNTVPSMFPSRMHPAHAPVWWCLFLIFLLSIGNCCGPSSPSRVDLQVGDVVCDIVSSLECNNNLQGQQSLQGTMTVIGSMDNMVKNMRNGHPLEPGLFRTSLEFERYSVRKHTDNAVPGGLGMCMGHHHYSCRAVQRSETALYTCGVKYSRIIQISSLTFSLR